MKKIMFVLFATILFSLNGNAQNKSKSENTNAGYIAIYTDNEVTKYKFDNIEDLEENADKILNEIRLNTSKDENCKITFEISLTISNGNLSKTITAVITTNYHEIIEEAQKLQNKIIALIK